MHPDVIRHAAIAAQSRATEVARALMGLLAADSVVARTFAERRLREALEALAAGHEAGAHDGDAYAVRRAAARAALVAWGAE